MITLYRFWDEAGGLLYVGITGHFPRRATQHAGVQPWWERVASATFEHYPDRKSAALAERRAICNQRPEFNVMGVIPERGFWPLWDRIDPDKADTADAHLGTAQAEEWVTSTEVASRLGVDLDTLKKWAVRGFDPLPQPRRVDRDNLWSWPEVEAWARRTDRLPGEST